jgi:hypothetical protein
MNRYELSTGGAVSPGFPGVPLMQKITEPQSKILLAVLKDDVGAAYKSKQCSAVLSRLMANDLLRWNHKKKTGRQLTPEGICSLYAWYKARWTKSGCLAHQQDLDQVEKLISAVQS